MAEDTPGRRWPWPSRRSNHVVPAISATSTSSPASWNGWATAAPPPTASVPLVGPDGLIFSHRKTHIWWRSSTTSTAGQPPLAFRVHDTPSSLAIGVLDIVYVHTSGFLEARQLPRSAAGRRRRGGGAAPTGCLAPYSASPACRRSPTSWRTTAALDTNLSDDVEARPAGVSTGPPRVHRLVDRRRPQRGAARRSGSSPRRRPSSGHLHRPPICSRAQRRGTPFNQRSLCASAVLDLYGETLGSAHDPGDDDG